MQAKKNKFTSLIADYFYFTRSQRRATIAIAVLLVGLIAANTWFTTLFKPQTTQIPAPTLQTLTAWKAYQTAEQQTFTQTDKAEWRKPKAERTSQWNLHAFDPNTVTAETLAEMGFREKSIATLMNFRAKGGKYKQPNDILKMYSLFDDEKAAILPYITIANIPSNTNYTTYTNSTPSNNATNKPTYNSYKPTAIDINTADTTEWKTLPGIGSKLSARIIKYRDALGGFYTTQQVAETFGVPDSTFQKIKPLLLLQRNSLQLLNLNLATQEQLNAHPYISSSQARFIVNYRQQHGPYTNTEALMQMELFSQEWLEKIKPYLAF